MNSNRARVCGTALLTWLLVCACGSGRGAAGWVRSSPLGTYPKESVALMVLEVRRARAVGQETPWIKRLASYAEEQGGPFREVTRRLGPEVLEHLDRMSVGYALLAEGTFDAPKIRQALGGTDLLTIVEAEGTDFSVALMPQGSIGLGPKRILESMRANAGARGHGLDDNQAILTPLERGRPEALFWGAADCRGLQKMYREASRPPDLGDLPIHLAPIQSLLSIAFRGTLEDSLNLDLFGQSDTADNARTLADAARGLIALGRVGAGRDRAKAWLDFLDAVRIEQSGPQINLTAAIPAKSMEAFVAQAMQAPRQSAETRVPASQPEPQTSPAPTATASRPAEHRPAPSASPSTVRPVRPPSGTRPSPAPRGTQTPAAGAP